MERLRELRASGTAGRRCRLLAGGDGERGGNLLRRCARRPSASDVRRRGVRRVRRVYGEYRGLLGAQSGRRVDVAVIGGRAPRDSVLAMPRGRGRSPRDDGVRDAGAVPRRRRRPRARRRALEGTETHGAAARGRRRRGVRPYEGQQRSTARSETRSPQRRSRCTSPLETAVGWPALAVLRPWKGRPRNRKAILGSGPAGRRPPHDSGRGLRTS